MRVKTKSIKKNIGITAAFLLYAFSVPLLNYSGYSMICNVLFLLCVIFAISSDIIVLNNYILLMSLFPIIEIVSAMLNCGKLSSLGACYSGISMLLVIIIMNSFIKYEDVSKIENAIILGSIGLSLVDICLYFVSGGGKFFLGRATANTNNLGVELAFSAAFIFNRIDGFKNKRVIVLFGLLSLFILLTQSRSALILLLVEVIIIWVFKYFHPREKISKQFTVGILATIIVFYFGIKSGFLAKYTSRFKAAIDEIVNGSNPIGSASKRMDFKKIGFSAFVEKPFWGHGIGTTKEFLEGTYFHDNYVELLFEVGIIGLIAFLTPLIFMMIKALKKRNYLVLSLVIGVLVEGIFDVYYHNKLYYLIFGLCIISLKSSMKENANEKINNIATEVIAEY